MTIVPDFWTSDPHFFHAGALRFRPEFSTLDEMNETIEYRWNNTVRPGQIVRILGDVVMGHREETLPFLLRLNGTLILDAGNHDNCWFGHGPKHEKWIDRYIDAGISVIIQGASTVEIDGQTINVCHFPYEGDHTEEDRYPEFRPVDDGNWLFHGHVHDMWKVQGRQINVGQDVWDYTPVPTSTLMSIVNSGGQP